MSFSKVRVDDVSFSKVRVALGVDDGDVMDVVRKGMPPSFESISKVSTLSPCRPGVVNLG